MLPPAADQQPRVHVAGVGDVLRWEQIFGRQAAEVTITVGVLNRMLDLGRPEYVRIG